LAQTTAARADDAAVRLSLQAELEDQKRRAAGLARDLAASTVSLEQRTAERDQHMQRCAQLGRELQGAVAPREERAAPVRGVRGAPLVVDEIDDPLGAPLRAAADEVDEVDGRADEGGPLIRLRGLLPESDDYSPANARSWERRLRAGDFFHVLQEVKSFLGLTAGFDNGEHAVTSLPLALLDYAMRCAASDFEAAEPLLVVSFVLLRVEVKRATVSSFKAARFLAELRARTQLEDPDDFLTDIFDEACTRRRGGRKGEKGKDNDKDKKEKGKPKGTDKANPAGNKKQGGAQGERQ
jgi:hypothetical protein